MKKITPVFFQELSKKKYLSYIKSLPDFRQEKNQTYAALALTILAISFFGMFAISPTLSTIAELQKKRNDAQFVDEQLTNKLRSLSLLQENYNTFSPSLPIVYAAVPQEPQVAVLLGQLKMLAEKNNLTIELMQAESVDLVNGDQEASEGIQSFIISVDATGSYENLAAFYKDAVRINRLLSLETITIAKQQLLTAPTRMVMKLKAYYKE